MFIFSHLIDFRLLDTVTASQFCPQLQWT